MSEQKSNIEASQPTLKAGGIDPAALFGAAIAATISSIAPEGPYEFITLCFGFTLLTLIIVYDVNPNRNRAQSLAFSCVISLVLLMIFCPIFEKSIADIPSPGKSAIHPNLVAGFWVISTALVFCIDRNRSEIINLGKKIKLVIHSSN